MALLADEFAPPRSPRYRTLDHWRGIACLLVVLFHSSAVAYMSMEAAGNTPASDGLSGLLLTITRIGWVGVPFFFVISGYAISATVDASRRGRGGPTGYLRRRIRRIYPPYWAMIALQVGIVLLVDVVLLPGLLSSSIAPIERPWDFEPAQWLGNLTLTESWRFQLMPDPPRDYLLGQAWTLCYEEQFYLVAGAALILAPRRYFLGTALVTVAVLAIVTLAPILHLRVDGFFFDGYWLAFAAGVLIYRQVNYGDRRTGWIAWGLLAAGLAYALFIVPKGGDLDRDLAAAALFAMILYGLHRFDARLATWPTLRPLKLAGTICYSLYLSHAVVVRSISQAMFDAGWRDTTSTVLLVLPVCLAAAIGFGWVFHRVVERRFLNPASDLSPSGVAAN
jgi:peptidoglycan/LPS O-acetylase OafA/YrhL